MVLPLIWIGIDPGASGSVSAIDINNRIVETWVFKSADVPGRIALTIADALGNLSESFDVRCVAVERVAAYPGQGVSSTFAFGRAYGEAIGAASVSALPVETVPPQRWQRDLELISPKGTSKTAHKRSLRDRAIEHFGIRLTLKECDSVWIAYWSKTYGSCRQA